MIDYEEMRKLIAKGLKDYLKVPVIRSNQNEKPPKYPYISYTITTLASANNGTYGAYSDGYDRKPITQTWSVSALSDKSGEDVNLIVKAREWFEYIGTQYLNDNDVIVQSVTSITNRDNLLSIGYEYKHGFDVVFWLFDTVESKLKTVDTIESIEINPQINT